MVRSLHKGVLVGVVVVLLGVGVTFSKSKDVGLHEGTVVAQQDQNIASATTASQKLYLPSISSPQAKTGKPSAAVEALVDFTASLTEAQKTAIQAILGKHKSDLDLVTKSVSPASSKTEPDVAPDLNAIAISRDTDISTQGAAQQAVPQASTKPAAPGSDDDQASRSAAEQQFDALRKAATQLQQLQAQVDSEIDAILTPEQQSKYQAAFKQIREGSRHLAEATAKSPTEVSPQVSYGYCYNAGIYSAYARYYALVAYYNAAYEYSYISSNIYSYNALYYLDNAQYYAYYARNFSGAAFFDTYVVGSDYDSSVVNGVNYSYAAYANAYYGYQYAGYEYYNITGSGYAFTAYQYGYAASQNAYAAYANNYYCQ